ncbi:MAG: SDR family oxidoreductase [Candidatus Adlerbacteria bacterium]
MAKKYAITTGGTGYVGSAVTDMLVTHGFEVTNMGRAVCDLADPHATHSAAEKILAEKGAPDIIIHMACPPTTRKALEDTAEEETRIEFAVAMGAAEILAHTFLPHMKQGSVFIGMTTASLEKEEPEKNIGAYIPAKAALRALLKNLSSEWGKKGIRVFDVAPTFLPGGLNKHIPEGVRNLLARQKDGTIPTAGDVAKTIEKLIQG